MYRRLVLDALAQAARAGEDHLARQSLSGADPVVRARLRRRIADRIAVASASVADRSDRSHALRLAFLQEAGADDDIDPEDRAAVRAAFDAASAGIVVERKHRVWYASLSAAIFAAGVALGAFRLTHPPLPFSPLSTPLGVALGPELTEYIVSVHERGRALESGSAPKEWTAATPDAVLSKLGRELGIPKGGAFERLLASYRDLALGRRDDAAMSTIAPATRTRAGTAAAVTSSSPDMAGSGFIRET